MDEPKEVSTLFNLICALSEAMDLVSPLVVDHHKKTAWLAVHLAEGMGLSEERIQEILKASLLHDIGAFSLKERLDTLYFEFENPHHHACLGYSLLKDSDLFRQEALIILAHHTWWEPEKDEEVGGRDVPLGSHLIHLADRVAINLDTEGDNPWSRVDAAMDLVSPLSGSVFMPEAVEALFELGSKDDFWVDLFDPDLEEELRHKVDPRALEISPEDLQLVARIFATIIDYRSPFTATHSAGVAAVAETLARYLGFSETNCSTMRVAGYLHDLGKLAVPVEILDKKGRLDEREYHRVQDHVVHTGRLLKKVPDLGYGIRWASQHHERLNGNGYPEHSAGREVAFGSRVVAMADIFAAVTEDRPYRKGMNREQTLGLLHRLTKEEYLDPEIYQVVEDNFDELERVRNAAQEESRADYRLRVECFDQAGGREV